MYLRGVGPLRHVASVSVVEKEGRATSTIVLAVDWATRSVLISAFVSCNERVTKWRRRRLLMKTWRWNIS